jgi:hypothetical protein
MAKKKTEEITLDPNRMYSLEDKNEIMRLFKIVNASQSDIDSIHSLYKKYIKSNARPPSTSCNCKGSVSHYWGEIKDFWSKNGHLFE